MTFAADRLGVYLRLPQLIEGQNPDKIKLDVDVVNYRPRLVLQELLLRWVRGAA